jgi:hypothetical protein
MFAREGIVSTRVSVIFFNISAFLTILRALTNLRTLTTVACRETLYPNTCEEYMICAKVKTTMPKSNRFQCFLK